MPAPNERRKATGWESSERIRAQSLSWTMAEDGLFMRRNIPGFYDEIAAGLP
jgi:hypothetical protein